MYAIRMQCRERTNAESETGQWLLQPYIVIKKRWAKTKTCGERQTFEMSKTKCSTAINIAEQMHVHRFESKYQCLVEEVGDLMLTNTDSKLRLPYPT